MLFKRGESSLSARGAAIAISLVAVAIASAALGVEARLLVADLRGDGLLLTDRFFPVDIDLDGDLATERVSWTAQGQDDGSLRCLVLESQSSRQRRRNRE